MAASRRTIMEEIIEQFEKDTGLQYKLQKLPTTTPEWVGISYRKDELISWLLKKVKELTPVKNIPRPGKDLLCPSCEYEWDISDCIGTKKCPECGNRTNIIDHTKKHNI
jgi:hypothetical protein